MFGFNAIWQRKEGRRPKAAHQSSEGVNPQNQSARSMSSLVRISDSSLTLREFRKGPEAEMLFPLKGVFSQPFAKPRRKTQ
jgi:hypothetical protein